MEPPLAESVLLPNRDLLDPNGGEDDAENEGFTANPEAVEAESVPETRSVGAGIPNSPPDCWGLEVPPPPAPPNIICKTRNWSFSTLETSDRVGIQ